MHRISMYKTNVKNGFVYLKTQVSGFPENKACHHPIG